MICPKCKTDIPDGLTNCPTCGTPLQHSSRGGPIVKSIRPYVASVFALIAIAAAVSAVVFREQLNNWKNRVFPPTCNIHAGVVLVDGECPKKCDICGMHLEKDGTCKNICQVHGVHLDKDGKCTNVCEVCGIHLGKDGSCTNTCPEHGVHLDKDGKCTKTCNLHPGVHLDKNGNCPKTCDLHPGVHLDKDNHCPKICDICRKHLEKDDGKRCPDTCDKHPKIHLIGGICRWCNPKYDDLDEMVSVRRETERDGRFYPEFWVIVANGVSTDRSDLNWILDDNDRGHGNPVPDGTSRPDGSPRKIWIWAPEEGFGTDETHVIQAFTWRTGPDGAPLLSRARPYTWTKICSVHAGVRLDKDGNCPKKCESCGKHLGKDGGTRCDGTCDTHTDTHLDKNGKCPKCAEQATIKDALAKALAAFRAEKWQEGQEVLAKAKVPESTISDPELQFYLGYCHERGKGGAVRNGEAVKRWYGASAEQGYAKAQFRLGYLLYGGDVELRVMPDTKQAKKWLEMAAEHGLQDAAELLEDIKVRERDTL